MLPVLALTLTFANEIQCIGGRDCASWDSEVGWTGPGPLGDMKKAVLEMHPVYYEPCSDLNVTLLF